MIYRNCKRLCACKWVFCILSHVHLTLLVRLQNNTVIIHHHYIQVPDQGHPDQKHPILLAVISSKSLESSIHCAGFTASVTAEVNIIPATTAKKRIPFFLVFTVKILNCHVISDCHRYENIIKVLNRQ